MNRKYVEDTLLKLGIPASIKGFKYITDAIMLLDEKEWKDPKYTALYYYIGKMNGSTAARTERAIRHAFSVARSCKGDFDLVNHYIGFINCENSNSIASLYRTLKYEMDHMTEEEEEELVHYQPPVLHPPKDKKEDLLYISEAKLREIIQQELLRYLRGTQDEFPEQVS